jgi:hypothetical protein
LLLLPELCFDRSPSAAQRLVSSWLDDSARSKSMRLVCLCEMHVARPHGPSSSPLILWHRCSHQGFPVAAGKGAVFVRLSCFIPAYSLGFTHCFSVPDAIRSCAETSREVLTMSRLAGVSSRIFGSLQHEELLQRNMAEWNHANLRMVQDVDGLHAMAAASPAVNPSTGPQSSGSLQPGGAASPYLSDVPSGVDSCASPTTALTCEMHIFEVWNIGLPLLAPACTSAHERYRAGFTATCGCVQTIMS